MPSTEFSIESLAIAGPYGVIPLRFYSHESGSRAGIVWVHGGGFSSGDLDMPESDWVGRELAQEGIAVLAVGYRLAPNLAQAPGEQLLREGARYPIASLEVTATFEWAISQPGRQPLHGWSLGGASAGANLAAGASMRLRDRNGPMPRRLVLAYPLVHQELPTLNAELAEMARGLSPEDSHTFEQVKLMSESYLGHGSGHLESYAFPGGADLTGLPPTFVLNSDFDRLRSSGQAFASELAAAGVDVLQIREKGTRHGHLNEPSNPAARRSVARMVAWLTSTDLLGSSGDEPLGSGPALGDPSPTGQ